MDAEKQTRMDKMAHNVRQTKNENEMVPTSSHGVINLTHIEASPFISLMSAAERKKKTKNIVKMLRDFFSSKKLLPGAKEQVFAMK